MASYSISQTGNWPNETYSIVPSDYNVAIQSLSSLQAENLIRFFNNPINDIDKLTTNNIVNFNYGNSIYYRDELSLFRLTSKTFNNTFTWNPAQFRTANLGPVFNFLNIKFTPQVGSSSDITKNLDYRGYLLYPQRLFLRPISAFKEGNNFVLVTSSVFINYNTFYISSSSCEYDAYTTHLKYQNTRQNTTFLRSLGNPVTNFNLIYSISASKQIINNPLITYTNNYNPISFNYNLEDPSKTVLRPDSTFIKFNSLVSENYIGQGYPDETYGLNHGFRSSFIQNVNLNDASTQTFQLVQSTLKLTSPLEDLSNAILTIYLNLTNTNLKYNALYYTDNRNTPIAYVKGVSDKTLEVKYIAESPYYFNTDVLVNSDTSATIRRYSGGILQNSTPVTLNSNIVDTTNTPFDTIYWSCAKPLHYYTFKTSFSGANYPGVNETSNLNFALSTWTTSSTTSSFYLSSCLTSNFGFLNLNLQTFAPNDRIALKIVNDLDNVLLSSLKCFYGTNYTIEYDILRSPYVPVNDGKQFLITYPDKKYGALDLVYRTSLSGVNGQITDSPYAQIISFAPNEIQSITGYRIYLRLLNEIQNKITLDASHLTVYPEFPGRDLTNSLITWDYSPKSNATSIYSVDADGNIVSYITPNSAIAFNNSTFRIAVSGYGPNTTTITLSSQKYNETATVTTDSLLFDYLSENYFVVGASKIDTSSQIMVATLTAGCPIEGNIYPIPTNIPLYWTWSYDGITSPEIQPITAFNVNDNKVYSYGANEFSYNLSSIKINIDLTSSTNSFNIRKAKFYLTSHYKKKDIIGSYEFSLQDYPNSKFFNTDFTTTYRNYPLTAIANTRKGINTITRPREDYNNYTFYSNTDVLPAISASYFQWTITDDINSINTPITSTKINTISSINYNIKSNARKTIVTLSAINAKIAGWNTSHDISSTTTIYTIPSSEFYTQTNFIVYPPYYWKQGNSGKLTLIDQSNFTLSLAPTAYTNKKSKTQNFYFSANKIYNVYEYAYSSNKLSLTPATSNVALIDIPYNNELIARNGCMVYLTAYNDLYPKVNGLNFVSVRNSNVYTDYFRITANTTSFDNLKYDGIAYPYYITSKYVSLSGGMLAFWDFNQNASLYTDTVSNRMLSGVNTSTQNGLLLSGVRIQGNNPNYSYLVYNGNNQLIKDTPFTVSMWAYFNDVNTLQTFFTSRMFDFEVNNGFLRVRFNTSGGTNYTTSLNTIQTGKWYHLLFTYDLDYSSNYYHKFYVDGVLQGQATQNLLVLRASYANKFVLGADIDSIVVTQFNGILDCFGIWDRSLNEGSEILDLYNSGLGYEYNASTKTIVKNVITSVLSAFSQSPKLFPYETLTLNYSAVNLQLDFNLTPIYTQVSSIDLDNNIFVGILQSIVPPNTATTPVRSLQQYGQGEILYTISTDYWKSTKTLPAVDGYYDLFSLNIGDANEPLTVSPYKKTNLTLSVSAKFPAKIPSSTFDLYPNYTEDTDLWESAYYTSVSDNKTISVYSTSVKPEIYISSYYNLTGENLLIQFDTPENSENLYISSYKIYFGDGSYAERAINDKIYYSYDSIGVYNISYEVLYNDGQTKSFVLQEHPITVLGKWPTYDQSKIRLLSETNLTLPWTLNEINIQPNEFGVADIFNDAITKLYENLDYLKYNSQTISTDSPTIYYGWLGNNNRDTAKGIKWHTPDLNSIYQNNPDYATSVGTSYFTNIKDISETENYMFVLDGSKFRTISAGIVSQEVIYDNIESINSLLVNPISITATDDNTVYVADSIKNKIYKFNLNFDYVSEINVQLNIGGFGDRSNPNKFNSPTEVHSVNDIVYILDYNNLCVKQFTSDLNWIYTYYVDSFFNDRPKNITIHPNINNMLLYVLSEKNNIYVFDYMGDMITSFPLNEIKNQTNDVVKITFDEGGDFIYVVTTRSIYKYSLTGTLMSILEIPNSVSLVYTSAKFTNKRSLLFSTENSIIKCQDVISIYKIGEGLPFKYWSKNQILVSNDEFATDIVYNRALTRLVQNIKTFRDLIDSRFVIVTETTKYGTVRYYSKFPVSVEYRPTFSDDIENEKVMVGVNEFNIPSVFNREFKKIYDALTELNSFLTITDVRLLSGIDIGCSSPFCWSWKAMSCYNLSLPVIRICDINPITYAELKTDYPVEYTYAPTNTWDAAYAACCSSKTTTTPGAADVDPNTIASTPPTVTPVTPVIPETPNTYEFINTPFFNS